MQSEGNNLE